MKICLINLGKFAARGTPLGLAYLASYIQKYDPEKHRIEIIDEFAGDVAEEKVLKLNPDIVGITSTSPQISRAMEVAKFAKENYDVPIIIGGVHVSALPERTLEEGKFDIGVLGEGEVTFFELIQALKKGSLKHNILKKIKGICYRSDGKFVLTEPRPLIENLDSIPFPARELLNMEYYLKPYDAVRGVIRRSTQVISSRGCPFNCVFCASSIINQRRFRTHSAEYVVNEVEHLIKKYRVEAIFFTDDNFIVNKERAKKICELMINRGISEKIVWAIQVRADSITSKDLEFLKLLKKAGCIQTEFGFESGSPNILAFLKKNTTTVKQNSQAIKFCRHAGLRVFGNFMIGTVGETRDDIEMTRKFILEHNKDLDGLAINLTRPYPGTELWKICEERGLLKNLNWNDLKFNFQYFLNSPRCFSDNLTQQELLDIHRELSSIMIEKFSLSTKIKKLVSNPTKTIPLVMPYIYYRIKKIFH